MSVPTVSHLLISLAHGGLERLVVDWTNARNNRHPGSTRVVCLDEAGELAGELDGDVLTVLRADRSRFPWDRVAVRTLSEYSPTGGEAGHVLHSHNIAAQQYAALGVRRTSSRHVHTEHGSNVYVKGVVNRARLRRLGASTHHLACVSSDAAEKIAPHWGVDASAITVVPNGVTPHPDFSREEIEASREALGIATDEFVIGSIGRFSKEKGYDRLLESLPGVLQEAPDARVLLIGDGRERHALEAQADTLGIRDRLVLPGYQPNARRFYPLMSLFVMPSRSEGLSIALLEAMAAGLPVLVTRVGENPTVIDEDTCGWFLPEAQSAWTDVINARISDVKSGQGLVVGDAARQRCVTQYSQDATLELYEGIYAEVCRA